MKRGLTLIEVLVAIACLLIIFAVLFPFFSLARERAQHPGQVQTVRSYCDCNGYDK